MQRKRPNYRLPTDHEAQLDTLLQVPISGLFVGLRKAGNSDLGTFSGANYRSDEWAFDGGPLFLNQTHTNTTWVFEIDSILDSLVVRTTSLSPLARGFLDDLYKQDDYVPSFLRATRIAEVTDEFGVRNVRPDGVKVFKLPDNFRSLNRELASAAGVLSPSQCAVELEYEGGCLLIGHRMTQSGRGHRFMVWDDVSNEFATKELQLCFDISG